MRLSIDPIHLFLNTEALGRYVEARPYFNDLDMLRKHRCEAGTRKRSTCLRICLVQERMGD